MTSGTRHDEPPTVWAPPSLAPASPKSSRRTTVIPRGRIVDRVARAADLVERGRDEGSGLVSRAVFLGELDRILNSGESAAVLAVGIDWGTASGAQGLGDEELVVAVAHRVTDAVRGGDPVASFGTDGHLVIIGEITSPEVAVLVARRIVAAVSGPIEVRGRTINVAASVGIVLTDDLPDLTGERIIRAATRGRHQARALDGERVELVAAIEDDSSDKRALQWPRRELERAVQHAEFVAHYQPVVDVHTADLIGFEALVRWEHPKLGLLTPPEFVDAAEATGVLVRIGTEVMRQAFRQLTRWTIRSGDRPLTMAINLSTRQLLALDFVDTVVDVVRASGTPEGLVRLEVDETDQLLDPRSEVVAALHELNAEGITLCLDDFGSHAASFQTFGHLDFGVAKLSRAMVTGVVEPAGAAVVTAMVALAHSLGLVVVAEGVETPAELTALRKAGCDQAQGHLFSRSRPAHEIDRLIDRWIGQSAR